MRDANFMPLDWAARSLAAKTTARQNLRSALGNPNASQEDRDQRLGEYLDADKHHDEETQKVLAALVRRDEEVVSHALQGFERNMIRGYRSMR
jgi:hypothetical protein